MLYESTDATNPPVLETDSHDNLYLGRPDFVSLEVLLYGFLASSSREKSGPLFVIGCTAKAPVRIVSPND